MKIDILGVKVNPEPKNKILELIRSLLDANKQVFIVTPYSESVVSAQTNSEYRTILNSANIALPDGIGILWAAAFLKRTENKGLLSTVYYLLSTLLGIMFKPSLIRDPIRERIPGSSFVWDLSRLASDRGESVFVLGGFGDTPELAAKKLKARFPRLTIAGTCAKSRTEQGIIQEINRSGAGFLFVAFGPEIQEKWIHQHLEKLDVKLAIGLGGTFDYLAGKRPSAPEIWAQNGLEWLWRLISQPWRVLRISKGVLGLIYYCFKHRLQYN